jgi:2,3-bisphosphoglycerate-independent phosphoglycerate mutase
MDRKKPLVLMILDGWGMRESNHCNAVEIAQPHNFTKIWNSYPHTLLRCSGLDVGLPEGQMGNSEVGHLNIGSGRVVYQEIVRINNAIKDGSFFTNPELVKAIEIARDGNRAVHLMGLLSDGGVHSHLDHLYALLQLCHAYKINRVFIHGFLDGRDVNPKSALTYAQAVEERIKELCPSARIASVAGRFYGMDRDNRWERTEKAYNALTLGEGKKAPNVFAAIQNSYEARVSDEFVEPTVIVDHNSQPVGLVSDQDVLIFFNFRADRARQITKAFIVPDFSEFNRQCKPRVHYVCFTQYDINLKAPVAFLPQNLNHTLGEVLAEQGIRQLRIAETEKYAHVTFFFNGGVEEPNPGEDRILIPSPEVETYNLKPEMSAYEITRRVIEEIERDYYDVIIINYANPDMVGHTGILEAAVKAVTTVDQCLMQVVAKVLDRNGTVLITADHGNCELMVCPDTGGPHTAHTTEKVPFILVGEKYRQCKLRNNCSLRDIAPTILQILDLDIPAEMTGQSILDCK